MKTKVKVMLGKQDNFLPDKDVSLLESNFRDSGVNFEIRMVNNCGHMTFMWGRDPSRFFKYILGYLEDERSTINLHSSIDEKGYQERVQANI